MSRPVFVLADDGEGEPTIWYGATPILRRIDLHPDVRHYWPLLATRILLFRPREPEMTNLSPAHAASQELRERVVRIALEDAATEILQLRKELAQALDDLDTARILANSP